MSVTTERTAQTDALGGPDAVVDAALRMLGSTGDEVAARLHEAAITGQQHCAAWCPIAEWVQRVTGRQIAVLGSHWRFTSHTDYGTDRPAPAGVADFVRRFDAGDFQWLRAS